MLLFSGIVDLGRGFYYHTVLASAVHEGARLGASSTATDAQVRAAVSAAAQDFSASSNFKCCEIAPAAPRPAGTTISVSATYQLVPVTPLMQAFMGGALELSRTARMVVI